MLIASQSQLQESQGLAKRQWPNQERVVFSDGYKRLDLIVYSDIFTTLISRILTSFETNTLQLLSTNI
jgi:hypothetical protein